MTPNPVTRESPALIAAGVNEAAAWAAVIARDRRHDGEFVYAVSTTGIYCRPGCPSRHPLRRHVRFFATPDDAESAGFRACLRCRPREAVTPADRAVEAARTYLETHVDERVSLAELAREVGLSPHHLQRTFKRVMGVSPRQFAAALRADRLKRALRAEGSVSRATYEAGYSGSSRAYDAAETHLGMTPAAYRRGGRGVRIRFATAATRLGRLLVAATERGLCAVTLGDDDDALERALAEEYPEAVRERAGGADDRDAELRGWVRAIVRHIEGTEPALTMPVDVAGTPFQERVWDALRTIPYGATRSYAQVAAAVGAPTAVRAVASACARNHVALVIPCHRVVRSAGGAGGYRWGTERKRALLAQERRAGAAAAR
jgi:AraC family transcriptional regulator of adaptative response/methylated-DNA-[protein]-cysteine methyltransferase